MYIYTARYVYPSQIGKSFCAYLLRVTYMCQTNCIYPIYSLGNSDLPHELDGGCQTVWSQGGRCARRIQHFYVQRFHEKHPGILRQGTCLHFS